MNLRQHGPVSWVSSCRAIVEIDDYLVLCLPLPFAAPVAVILLVCISSPIYLSKRTLALTAPVTQHADIRLQESIAALQLFVLSLDRFHAVDEVEQACLKLFRLS